MELLHILYVIGLAGGSFIAPKKKVQSEIKIPIKGGLKQIVLGTSRVD